MNKTVLALFGVIATLVIALGVLAIVVLGGGGGDDGGSTASDTQNGDNNSGSSNSGAGAGDLRLLGSRPDYPRPRPGGRRRLGDLHRRDLRRPGLFGP